MNAYSNSNAAHSLGDEFGLTTAAVLLCALESAHKRLTDCICQMETATSAREPDLAALTHARYRISQASYAKRQLATKACAHLLQHVGKREAGIVQSLQRDNAEYLRRSTEHVRRWPPAALEQDWPGYRAASREIRTRLKEVMRTEQRLLVPMLRAYEHL